MMLPRGVPPSSLMAASKSRGRVPTGLRSEDSLPTARCDDVVLHGVHTHGAHRRAPTHSTHRRALQLFSARLSISACPSPPVHLQVSISGLRVRVSNEGDGRPPLLSCECVGVRVRGVRVGVRVGRVRVLARRRTSSTGALRCERVGVRCIEQHEPSRPFARGQLPGSGYSAVAGRGTVTLVSDCWRCTGRAAEVEFAGGRRTTLVESRC